MARRKITYEQAARELRQAYDEGLAEGLAGEMGPPNPFIMGAWQREIDRRRYEGRRDGCQKFVERVRAVKCGELPPPFVGPPPKVTFDPGYLYGEKAR